jgi:phosphoglycolate phosphatase-like HAD superfamily hydrolase
VSAALRRLAGAGVRIGVYSDAPRELVDIALAHLGVARSVAATGTLDDVRRELGDDVRVVTSRDELATVS